MILPVYKHTSGPAIVSFPEFARNFDIFTEGQLRRLNWNNVFVAGGYDIIILLTYLLIHLLLPH